MTTTKYQFTCVFFLCRLSVRCAFWRGGDVEQHIKVDGRASLLITHKVRRFTRHAVGRKVSVITAG